MEALGIHFIVEESTERQMLVYSMKSIDHTETTGESSAGLQRCLIKRCIYISQLSLCLFYLYLFSSSMQGLTHYLKFNERGKKTKMREKNFLKSTFLFI